MAGSRTSSSFLISPTAACEVYIAWRARAAPGARFGVAASSAARQASLALERHQSLDRNVSDERIRVGRPRDDRPRLLDLGEPAKADNRLEPHPRIRIGKGF